MKFDFNEKVKESILAIVSAGTLLILIWTVLHDLSGVIRLLSKILNAILPFIIGICLVFILNPLRKTIEFGWFKKLTWKPSIKRKLAVVLSMVLFILAIVCFFWVLIPQLIQSFSALADSMDSYMTSFEGFLEKITSDPNVAEIVTNAYDWVRTMFATWISSASTVITTVVGYSVSVVKGLFNFFVGMIVATYLLLESERFSLQARRVIYAVVSKKHADRMYHVLHLASKMFAGFIFGKALDSLIIGILCYICCLIMKMPYSPLIAFIIGITNMIPFFGPFLGAIPCAFILLIISPFKALEFGIFILILQQIDGNIIGPKILGDSLGLPTLWVLFAIVVGGALFGILGMFFAVPIFSVIYVMIRDWINQRLEEKEISI